MSSTEARVEEIRHLYHLDRAYPIRYAYWLKNLATLDLGISPTSAEAILPTYLDRFRVGGRYNQHAPA